MSGRDEDAGKPDVEAIVRELRGRIREAADEPDHGGAEPDDRDLYGNLKRANESCQVACGPAGGLPARLMRRVLRGPLAEINRFHAHAVRVLNQVVKVLDGTEQEPAGPLLDGARRRRDLLEQVSARLAEYDALRIDERLKRLEAEAAGKERAAQ